MIEKSILVLGKQGQVAQALRELISNDFNVVFADRKTADFQNPIQTIEFINQLNPDIIINTSAYTAVDKAESEPEIADLLNHQVPAALAKWSASHQKTLVHYSTDYVFDGSGIQAHSEEATTNPVNIYGKTKLAGDQAIIQSGAHALILRTSWIFSHQGQNFFRTMLRLGSERDELSIVNDQIGSPTYAPHLAEITLKMLIHPHFLNQRGPEIYNVCGTGYCSWYDFATEIFRLATQYGCSLKVKSLKAIPSVKFPTPAQRPLNSRLNQNKLKRDFGMAMPRWEDALIQAFDNAVI